MEKEALFCFQVNRLIDSAGKSFFSCLPHLFGKFDESVMMMFLVFVDVIKVGFIQAGQVVISLGHAL